MSASTLGQFVRDRRIAAKLTQRELAELAGVGVRFISELESDKPTLRLDAVHRVLAIFGKRLGPVDLEREAIRSDEPSAESTPSPTKEDRR